MKTSYLDFLQCPKCASESLTIDAADDAPRIKEGTIRCAGCGSSYPIINHIPRFSRSTPYADSFGPQWRTFAKSQLDTETTKESAIRFDSEIGWTQNDLRGKLVVEFGSGAGRFVDVASRRGAKLVVGLDATDAVDAAQENLIDRENVFFVQADIFSSPFRKASFDFGYSIGVFHHTPQPERAFHILAQTIRPGGCIGLSLYEMSKYPRPNRTTLKVATLELGWALNEWRCELFRTVTTRLPRKLFLTYCKTVVPVLHVINKVPVLRYVRYLLPSTCYRHLPVVWSMVDTHDTYCSQIVHQYRGKDLFQWFLHEGMSEIVLRNSRAGFVSITAVVEGDDIRAKRQLFLEQPGMPGYTRESAVRNASAGGMQDSLNDLR